jgi:hypothetical protein
MRVKDLKRVQINKLKREEVEVGLIKNKKGGLMF